MIRDFLDDVAEHGVTGLLSLVGEELGIAGDEYIKALLEGNRRIDSVIKPYSDTLRDRIKELPKRAVELYSNRLRQWTFAEDKQMNAVEQATVQWAAAIERCATKGQTTRLPGPVSNMALTAPPAVESEIEDLLLLLHGPTYNRDIRISMEENLSTLDEYCGKTDLASCRIKIAIFFDILMQRRQMYAPYSTLRDMLWKELEEREADPVRTESFQASAETTEEQKSEAMETLLDLYTDGLAEERMKQAAAIIENKVLSTNEKLGKLDGVLPIPPTCSGKKLGKALGVSKAAIQKTDWYQQNRKGIRADLVGRREDTHRERAELHEATHTGDKWD